MTTTHRIIKTLLLIGALACLVWLMVTPPADATDGACGIPQAKRAALRAHKALVKAKAADKEARRILSATRAITSAYSRDGFTKADGKRIGKWVRLLRQVGFRWSQIGQAIAIGARESRGDPSAKNPTSTASGWCQWLAMWWDGSSDYGWTFNPFNVRECLRYFERCVNHTVSKWTPWNPLPSVRWSPSW